MIQGNAYIYMQNNTLNIRSMNKIQHKINISIKKNNHHQNDLINIGDQNKNNWIDFWNLKKRVLSSV